MGGDNRAGAALEQQRDEIMTIRRTPSYADTDRAQVDVLAEACQSICAQSGVAHRLAAGIEENSAQINKWRGAFSLAAKLMAFAVAFLTLSITVSFALAPYLVRAAVRDEFDRRMGVADSKVRTPTPSAEQLREIFRSAQAAEGQKQ